MSEHLLDHLMRAMRGESFDLLYAQTAYGDLKLFYAKENLPAPKWECFKDRAYYDFWCVRMVGDRKFGLGFHLANEDEAKALANLLEQNKVGSYGK